MCRLGAESPRISASVFDCLPLLPSSTGNPVPKKPGRLGGTLTQSSGSSGSHDHLSNQSSPKKIARGGGDFVTMVLRRVSQPDLRWDCKGSTTSPSPSLSPLLSNVSLSPMARQNMSVSSLLNGGMSSDEVSQPTFSSPPSRLSTPPDSGGDARPGEYPPSGSLS